MPPERTLRQRILSRETLYGTFLNLGSPMVAEVCARTGLDWLLMDLEHGASGDTELLAMLLACKGTAATPLVRVEQGTRLRIGRALDLGAAGIMVPQVNTVADARDIVSWLRYPPAGRRGVALFTRGADYGSGGHAGVDARNEEVVGILQVESAAAVDAADEIAALDGVDVLFVGPTDLSHQLGIRGQIDHPDFQRAIERVAEAARRHGKAAGVLLWKPDDATRYAELGFTFFSISGDGQLLDRSVRAGLEGTRAAVAAGTQAIRT